MRLLRDQSDSYLEAVVTDHLGDTYAALQRPAAAATAWRRAADLLTRLGHPDVHPVRAKLAPADRPGPPYPPRPPAPPPATAGPKPTP
jgi:hypothetical protein